MTRMRCRRRRAKGKAWRMRGSAWRRRVAKTAHAWAERSGAGDRDLVHAHGREGAIVAVGAGLFDLLDDVHAFDDPPENRVSRRSWREPIEVMVMHGVDEKLTRAAIGIARVGHRQRAWFIGNLGIRGVFVADGAMGRIASARQSALGITAMRTSKLNHEVVDDAMKVQPIVEATFRERNEVLRGDRHLVEEQLDGKVAERRFAKCGRVCHGRAA